MRQNTISPISKLSPRITKTFTAQDLLNICIVYLLQVSRYGVTTHNIATSPASNERSLVCGGHVLPDLAEEAQFELVAHEERLMVALAEHLAVRADRFHALVIVGLRQLIEGALQPGYSRGGVRGGPPARRRRSPAWVQWGEASEAAC